MKVISFKKDNEINISESKGTFCKVRDIQGTESLIIFCFDDINYISSVNNFQFNVIRDNEKLLLKSNEIKVGDKIYINYFFINDTIVYTLPENF
jgi:hypothetical protein